MEGSKTKKINFGVIGLGYIGKFHIKSCLKIESVNLVAVADRSKKALKFAESMGVKKTFTEYDQLLKDESIDAVIVSLPTHLHAPAAISALEQGKHVLLEKPLARNPKEGKEIISAARKSNSKLMVGYPLRFAPTFVDLKNKLDSGVLGEIQTAHVVNASTGPFFHRSESAAPRPVPDWWFNKELTGGGALIDLGSHMINLARWYFGEVKSVKAYLGYRFNFDFEDHAMCIVNFESGTTAVINVGWFSQKSSLGMDLFGTVAHASGYRSSPNRVITAIQLLLGISKFSKPYVDEVMHFINCIEEDSQPSPTADDALKDLEIITRAYNNPILSD